MKLLFDQNLSPKLVNRLADLFPDSSHVFTLGLDEIEDSEIWRFAKENLRWLQKMPISAI